MGKASELWDDSALINAFDQALSKYKALNSGKCATSNTGAESSSIDPILVASETETEIKDEIQQNVSSVEEETPHETSTVQEKQPEPESSSSQDYNQLMIQYYELEEKRQKILQKIQQAGYYCFPTYDNTSRTPASKERSYGTWSFPGVTYGPTGNHPIHPSTGGIEASGGLKSGINIEERETEKGDVTQEDIHGEVRVAETDLATVVNAWYSAGFYTGRYLLEQSYRRGC